MPDWDCVCGFGEEDAYGEGEWCASERMGSSIENPSYNNNEHLEQGVFTNEEYSLIVFLISTGYGWRKFAESVYKQGWCSEAQLDTMKSMEYRIRNYRWNTE